MAAREDKKFGGELRMAVRMAKTSVGPGKNASGSSEPDAGAPMFALGGKRSLTTFIRNGFERLEMLARTGSVDRPDILIAVPAALAAAGLALSSAIGYGRLSYKTWRDSAVLGAAVVMGPRVLRGDFCRFCAAVPRDVPEPDSIAPGAPGSSHPEGAPAPLLLEVHPP
jgi:hypothetical protein